MGGKPCVRGSRVTVSTIVGLLASGQTNENILKMYPYLQHEDIIAALSYAAWRCEEVEVPIDSKTKVLEDVRQAVVELNQVLASKMQARDAEDLLNEL